jgi:superfamily II DNA or RNA helicase
MRPATTLFGVPFFQDPRRGQREAFEHPEVFKSKLNIKLPTGYGKTFTACGIYSIRQHAGLATRMLYVVPTTGQLDQFCSSGPSDLAKVSVMGPHAISDLGYLPDYKLVDRHRKNECQVFAATIQYLFTPGGRKLVMELMATGQWMLVIDEYHHYGADNAWGKLISELLHTFLLAMSATPYRPQDDSAFGKPDVDVLYRTAMEEGAVKPLNGHAYHYTLDAVEEDGTITTYTSEQLVEEVGSDAPDAIQKFYMQKKMRWSPKYVSPLIRIPIERMQTQRIDTGEPLQVLVTAMCVSHAELVCHQISSMYPEFRVDWVGTGQHGRTKDENRAILEKFCPPKPPFEDMRRPFPELDILVHVGIAGEGLDTVHVSEVAFLCPASFNNSTYQIIGRASRALHGIEANVNFDASTELARGFKSNGNLIKAIGSDLIDAMDLNPPPIGQPDEPKENENSEFPPELPDEAHIIIADMRLTHVDSGDQGVRFMLKVMRATNPDFLDYDAVEADPDHPGWKRVIGIYLTMRSKEAEPLNEKAVLAQHQDSVINAVSNATGVVIALMKKAGARVERTLPGDIKKRINKQKMRVLGPVSHDVEVYKQHYEWVRALTKQLRETKKVPTWLG